MEPLLLPGRSPRLQAFSLPWSGAGVAERKVREGSQEASILVSSAGPPRF